MFAEAGITGNFSFSQIAFPQNLQADLQAKAS
jgi:hypothetical protein